MESHNNSDAERKAGPSNPSGSSLDDAVGKLLQGTIFQIKLNKISYTNLNILIIVILHILSLYFGVRKSIIKRILNIYENKATLLMMNIK